MSANDGDLVDRMAKKHSVSPAAVQIVLAALRSGGGRMAQFSPADFGGMSQWSPGMSMVGDMFNTQLEAKLDALCSDIAAHLDTLETAGGARAGVDVSYRSQTRTENWWPAGLGKAGLGWRAERSPIRGFSRDPAGDRRSRRPLGVRYGILSDFRYRAGAKCRSDAVIHQPGRARELRTVSV
jgi:hypothetical protein